MLRRCENVIADVASRQHRSYNMATWFFGFTVVILALVHPSRAIITNEEIVKMTDTQAVAGGTAQLLCDMEPPMPGDKVHLVIWYKEGNDTPIYSFDLRSQASMDHGNHWQDKSLANRAFFQHSVTPAKLSLEAVRENDAGLYRCRVDFKQSPTRNSKVNLTIIIPPDQLIILDKDETSNIKNYILGPYPEGSSLNITCVASGGRPQPRVTWWQQNALLDDSYEVIGTKRVRNVLTIEKLERKHLKAQLTCQASNNNLVSPISSTISLDMSLRPLWVRLQNNNRPFSAGKTYEITCEVVGARPEPKIVWTKGGIVLDSFKQRQRMSPDGNTTTSTLTFVPEVEDAGKFLSCKGSVPAIPDSEMEDDWKLEIHHAPETTLELGSNLNSSAIREGMDVYFECNIKSNPWVVKVSWKHNGVPLFSNTTAGTIVSNQSLVLQSVTRNRAGIYTCIGTNQEGEGESNPLKLDIKFAPVCRQDQTRVFGVGRQETARIPCDLEANPTDVVFTWKFNNTMEVVDIAQAQVSSNHTRSVASYTPTTELDYGTLLCWGQNDQGAQIEPCVFHIVPAGRPDTPHNCTVFNQTTNSLHVECLESFNGGLPQRFTVEVETETSSNALKAGSLIYNQTNKSPSFLIADLEPGTTYQISVFSRNSKGKSEPIRIRATTLNLPERRTGDKLSRPPSPENCTILEESRTSVKVSCAESDYVDAKSATYVLQVFDAETRRLLASATSLTPSNLEVTDLPSERSQAGLVLSLRVMTAHATSDATVLHSHHYAQEGKTLEHQRFPALSPVILSLSGPVLGAVVGAAAGLLLVIFVIVLAVRLRYRPRPQEDKDSHDDGGMATLTAPGDKSSSLPMSSDSIESFEKDPDIIPHGNDNSYGELCKGTSPRYVLQQPFTESTSLGHINSIYSNAEFNKPEQATKIPYSDLTLRGNRRIPPNCYQPVPVSSIQRTQLLPMSTLTRRQQTPDPAMYTQVASQSNKPIYIPPPRQYLNRPADESTAETPLIGCDNKITTITETTNLWNTEPTPSTITSTT